MSNFGERAASAWSEISRVVLVANLLVTVVAVGAQAAVLKLTGVDDVMQLAQVLGRTAPLALAIASIVFMVLWQLEHDEFHIYPTLLFIAAALFAATWLANRLGDLRVTEPVRNIQASKWGLPAAADYGLGMLQAYYAAYGVRDFWSSLIVGGALGWIWSRVLNRLNGQGPGQTSDQSQNHRERMAA